MMRKIRWTIAIFAGWSGGVLGQQEPRVLHPSPAYSVQQSSVPAATYPASAVPVQPRVVPAAAASPRAVPRAPQPLAVQPKRVVTSPAPKGLPAHPQPVQRTMTPLAVQPKRMIPAPAPVVQPPVVYTPPPPAVQPAAPKAVYASPPPVLAPAPVPMPVAPIAVAPPPVMMPAPVVAPVYAEPVYPPAVHDEPDMMESEPAPLSLARGPAVVIEEDWEEGGAEESSWPGIALGPKIGTTGLGLELTLGVNPYFNLRSGFNYLALSAFSLELSGVDYDTDLDLPSIPLMLDLYPGGGNFRISAGVFIQPGATIDLSSTPSSAVQIGAHTYGPDVVGTLSGEVELSNVVAPYLGIGFGNTVGEDKALSLSLDLGVMLQAYDVSLESNGAGMTALLNTFREDMKKEEDSVQDNMDDFKILPVLSLTLAYHF